MLINEKEIISILNNIYITFRSRKPLVLLVEILDEAMDNRDFSLFQSVAGCPTVNRQGIRFFKDNQGNIKALFSESGKFFLFEKNEWKRPKIKKFFCC